MKNVQGVSTSRSFVAMGMTEKAELKGKNGGKKTFVWMNPSINN